jgi:hypothetical protein
MDIPDTIRLVSPGHRFEARRNFELNVAVRSNNLACAFSGSASVRYLPYSVNHSSIGMLPLLFPRGGIHNNHFDHRHYRQIAARSPGGIAPPESRLIPGFFGVVACPLGLLLLGLLSFENVPWILPILGSLFFGVGMVYSFTSTFTYLVE